MDKIMPSTHFQAFFSDADHHPGLLTLHAVADTQDALMLLGLFVLPGPVVEARGQGQVGQVGQAVGRRWREGKRQTGASGRGSRSRMKTGVTQDGELWRQHALQRIHHIWKSHIVRTS